MSPVHALTLTPPPAPAPPCASSRRWGRCFVPTTVQRATATARLSPSRAAVSAAPALTRALLLSAAAAALIKGRCTPLALVPSSSVPLSLLPSGLPAATQWRARRPSESGRRASSSEADQKARVVFLGSPECVCVVLRTLVDAAASPAADFQLCAVVTQPAKKVGSGKKRALTKTPIQQLAEELGVEEILAPASARDEEFLAKLEALEPDLCITAAYGQYLPKRFLKAPRLGTLNLHPSLLPRWRGASPVQRALVAGDASTGITILYTVTKMDAGPIVVQRSMKLLGTETAKPLLSHLFKWGAGLLVDEAMPRVLGGQVDQASARPQEDSLVTQAPLIAKEEGRLWPHNETILRMRDKVRGFEGWPATTLPVSCTDDDDVPPRDYRAKVFGVEVLDVAELPPEDRERPLEELVFVPAQGGRRAAVAVRSAADPGRALLLTSLLIPGKAEMPAQKFHKFYMRGRQQPARWTWPEEVASRD